MKTEINFDAVTTGLPMSDDFTDGLCYQHVGHCLDAPEFISAGSSYGYSCPYNGKVFSMQKMVVRGYNAFISQ